MCVCCKTVCTKTSVSPSSRYSPKTTFISSISLFLFGHTFSIEPSMLPSDSAWAPSSFGRPSDTLSGLTACLPLGATQCSPSPKGSAITANGARLHRHCGGNDRVLTIGFQRKRHRVGKGGWGRRGGEWEQYAERSGNNMYLWKKN